MAKQRKHWSDILARARQRKHWSDILASSACPEGYRWARKQRSLEDAWKNCPKAEWMWWLICYHSDIAETRMVLAGINSNRFKTTKLGDDRVYVGLMHSDLTADEFRLLFPFPPKIGD